MHRLSHLVLSLALLAGCKTSPTTDDKDTDTQADTDVAGPSLAGVWHATGSAGPLDDEQSGRVAYVEFVGTDAGAAEGTVHLYGADDTSGVQSCPQALFARGSTGALLLSSTVVFSGTQVLLLSFDGTDALSLVDESGVSQTFERVAEVPTAARCGAVTLHEDVLFDVSGSSWANLLHNGTQLLLPVDGGEVFPINDLAGSVLGSVISYGTLYDNLVTMQGTDGWGHCACGGSEEIARTSPGGAQVDIVRPADLGPSIGVDGGAWDGTHLWVEGYDYSTRTSMLVELDTEVEPDLLVSQLELHLNIEHLVAHKGRLFALTQGGVVRLDTTTGKADATWALPPALSDTWWRGLTSDGNSIFLMGQPNAGGVRVVRMSLE